MFLKRRCYIVPKGKEWFLRVERNLYIVCTAHYFIYHAIIPGNSFFTHLFSSLSICLAIEVLVLTSAK
jgi:hypothetical protein